MLHCIEWYGIGKESLLYDGWWHYKRPQHANLCLADVLHGEVEPDSEAGVAGVRPDEEVKLKLTDVVNTAKVPCRGSEIAYISIK